MSAFSQILTLDKAEQQALLVDINTILADKTPEQRVQWAMENLPGTHILSSSFGIQAAVMLHLVTNVKQDVPVVLTDTGYLFPETYQFIDQLTQRLQLNLKVYKSQLSPAWQEAKYGKLWEQGEGGIKLYNQLNKVEPMTQALQELEGGNLVQWSATSAIKYPSRQEHCRNQSGNR